MYRSMSTMTEARLCCTSRMGYSGARLQPSKRTARICPPHRALKKLLICSRTCNSEAPKPMHDLAEIERSPLRCLWLTRMDPVPPDAGDLTYSLHLLSSVSRAGIRVTVLAMRRMDDRAQGVSKTDEIEWMILPSEENRERSGRLAVRSLFSGLPNVATQYNTASFRRALRVQMARDWDAIVVDHLGMGWVWPAVEAYRRRKASIV